MIYSTHIDDLRPDVAANCRVFIALMRAAGYKVQIVNTVRDEEKQRALYDEGVTRSKVPTFHSVKAGLAFDICQGVAGHGYDNEEFWKKAGEIGIRLGFEWGFHWKTFAEKPHFQWSEHGKYKGSMILSGLYPEAMPLNPEAMPLNPEAMPKGDEEEAMAMTDEVFAEYMKRYLSVSGTGDFPSEWAEQAASAAKDAGIINGDGQGNYGWQKPITREAVAVVVHNLVLSNLQKSGGCTGG